MTSHTPGPWVWHWFHDTKGELNSAHGTVLAYAAYEGMWFGRHNGEDEANARLIAAAPDLLEALQEMVRWHAKRETASMVVSGGEWLLPIDEQDAEVQQAMRVIAKATGATP